MLGWNLSGIRDVSPPIDPKNGQKIFFGSRGKFWSCPIFRQRSPDQWLHYPSRNLWKKRPQVHANDHRYMRPLSSHDMPNIKKKSVKKSVKNLWKSVKNPSDRWYCRAWSKKSVISVTDFLNRQRFFVIMGYFRQRSPDQCLIIGKITIRNRPQRLSNDQIHLANGGGYYLYLWKN